MTPDTFFESAAGFTKSPLGIIALFIVLVYGFASLVVGLKSSNLEQMGPLIWFMVLFPVLVFAGFLWLVAVHHNKLYGPSDFRDEENFVRTQIYTAAALTAATIKHTGEEGTPLEARVDNIVDTVRNTPITRRRQSLERRVLWVDDHPENNVYERSAFEAQGVEFALALSTEDALNMIEREKFAAIISDMGRKEGPREGYVLLDELRKTGNKTPYVIYAGSNAAQHKQEARERGADGTTSRADELFELIMAALSKA